ncbi:hypothetical protein [Flavobacterium lacus]|uniref:Uncharacterized protein n=1 Tax=Flavobacterium lacus TaxID=1353778 RepID=A0A328WYM1_9FLAO|nr:hypothetical protein [Flavobacterium lacus]RAR49004.1 hypothetical protein B0I10_104143 [Flavobacterium lacus]
MNDTKNKNIITLGEFKEKNYGKLGTKERDELEFGYKNFKIDELNRISSLEIEISEE